MKIDGKKLQIVRELAGRSRTEVGNAVGFRSGRIRVWQIERVDLVSEVNDCIVVAICKYLGCTVASIRA